MSEDRILGCLSGLVVGGALGTAVEFQARGPFPSVIDMAGGEVSDLAPGQWTGDMLMALCVTASLIETEAYNLRDQPAWFAHWYQDGYLSSMGRCSDIGNQTRAALEELETAGEPYHESVGEMSMGNGSLARLASVVMAFCDDPEAVGRFSTDSPRTTHLAVECVEACGVYGRLITAAIEGAPRTELYVLVADLAEQVTNPGLATILRGSHRVEKRDEISSSGYVLHDPEVTLWTLANTDNFFEGVLLAANLGDDADAVGAIYGQLAGALYGRSGIPENWRDRLHDTGMIEDPAAGIADRVGTFEVVVGWGKSRLARGAGLGYAHRR